MSIRQKLVILCFIILSGNGLVGYTAYKRNQKLAESERCLQHTEDIISLSSNLMYLPKNVEGSAKNFVITSDSIFLKPIYKAEEIRRDGISKLRELTVDNPVQQVRLDSLNSQLSNHLRFSLQMIELRSSQGVIPALLFSGEKPGIFYSERIQQITTSIQQEERELLKKRKQTNEKSIISFNRITRLMFILMTLLTILLLVLSGMHLIRNKEKEERIIELSLAYKKAKFRNMEKKKKAIELTIANQELVLKNEEKEKLAAELILANEELIKIEVDQKEYIVELEKMMHMISHEVRQPIAHLLGLSNLFDHPSNSSSGNLKKIIGFMKVAVNSLDVFTRDLTKYVSKMVHKRKEKGE